MTKPVKNQTFLITGSTDGIGKLTAMQLAGENASIIVHGRSEDKVKNVVKELTEDSGNNNIEGITADFSSLDEVRKMAEYLKERYSEFDVLINNAGAGFSDPRYSKDGYELRFAVNYLAPFLLTQMLLPLLKTASPSRIVNVSSAGQHKLNFEDIMMEKNFDSSRAYSQSKLALIMYTFELAEKLKDENVTVNALHPGTYLDTNMVRNAGIRPWGDAESGADAVIFLAVSGTLDGVTGKYFNVKKEAKADSQAYDTNARKKLWDLSLDLTNLK
jgi:NAD(P)-dependent dehydrogenase (short-subunit alcohol dehydrogenase family)